jgi:hypothetical protein
VKERSPLYARDSIEADLVNDTMLVVKAVDALYIKFLQVSQEEVNQNEAFPSIKDSRVKLVPSEQ